MPDPIPDTFVAQPKNRPDIDATPKEVAQCVFANAKPPEPTLQKPENKSAK